MRGVTFLYQNLYKEDVIAAVVAKRRGRISGQEQIVGDVVVIVVVLFVVVDQEE